jgi:protocatechuate 3,4-dioxygenase beta subunit
MVDVLPPAIVRAPCWPGKSIVVIIIIMESDDRPVGRVLSRREVVAALLGLSGVVLAAPGALAQPGGVPRCVVRPQQAEGPFFADTQLDRSDIRADPTTREARPGVLLTLAFNVSQLTAGACAPLGGARVDVWQCDAAGAYSNPRERDGRLEGPAFLRGYQTTDPAGGVRFTTIYPGGYAGRAVHIHFKIRTQGQEFTSQIYFDDAVTDRVHAQAPYGGGRRRLRNDGDGLYRHGGPMLTVSPVASGPGYTTTFDLALST